MKRYSALAAVDFGEISAGIDSTDGMLKRAPIGFVKSGTISHGRYLTLIGGNTAAVEEALSEGLLRGGASVLDHVLLSDVHPRLYDAILGQRKVGGAGSLAVIETGTVSSSIRAAERALKGTSVTLVEIRLADAGLSGKGLSIYEGELHDIEAAVQIATAAAAESGQPVWFKVVSAPHEALTRQMDPSTSFSSATLLDLDGEAG